MSNARYDMTRLGPDAGATEDYTGAIKGFIRELYTPRPNAPLKVGIERETFLVAAVGGKPLPHAATASGPSVSSFIEEIATVLGGKVTVRGPDGSATVAEGKFGKVSTEEGHQVENASDPFCKLSELNDIITSYDAAATEVAQRQGIRILHRGTDPQLTTGQSREELGFTEERWYNGYRGSPLSMKEPPGYSQVAAADQATIGIPPHAKTNAEMVRVANLLMLMIAPLADNSPKDGLTSERRHFYREESYMLTGNMSSFYESTPAGHTAEHDHALEEAFFDKMLDIPLEYLLRPTPSGDVKPYAVPEGIRLCDVVGKNMREMEVFKQTPQLRAAFEGHEYLTKADIQFALALVKPTVALKPGGLIELRMADSGPSSSWVMALASVARALHNPEFYGKISAVSDKLKPTDIDDLYHGGIDQGAKHQFKGRSIFEWAGDIVEAAAEALPAGDDRFLTPYRDAVRTKQVPANYAVLAAA